MGTLRNIRRKIQSDAYEMTDHARTEMTDDGLEVADIEHAILTGKIVRTLTEDARGVRCVIVGQSNDRQVSVVCRLRETGMLRIVTVWAGGYNEEYE